jgi:hypothetical protein
MNVQQLIRMLRELPAGATVLIEDDAGYSPLGGVTLQPGEGGMPDEVILVPDMTPD